MFRSKFSASMESFLSTSSSSSSVSARCGCPECKQVPHTARRPFFRRSLPSSSEPRTPTSSLNCDLPPPITLQKQQEQLLSMGYSKLFTLGYLSATSQGAFQPSD